MVSIYPQLPGQTYSVVKTPRLLNAEPQEHASGRDVRIGYAQYPLWNIELTYSLLRDTWGSIEYKTFLGFFLSVSGNLLGFALRDPDDCQVTSQSFVTTDGVTQEYGPLIRTIGAGGYSGSEPVGLVDTTQPFRLYRDGTLIDPSDPTWGYTVVTSNQVDQLVNFTAGAPPAGHVLTVDMSYFFWCRFAEPSLEFEQFMKQLYQIKSVKLQSLRGP